MYNPFSIFLLAIAAGALAIAYWLWQKRVAASGFCAIAAADENQLVKVRGTVAPDDQLVAPLTGRPCVYYRIELHVRQGNQTKSRELAAARDFWIRDASGAAQVLVERGAFTIVADIVELGRASELSDRTRRAFADDAAAGVAIDSIAPVAAVEVLEAIIAPGATVEVVGHAVREPAREPPASVDRGFRDPGATAIVFGGDVEIAERPRERRYLGQKT